jgi:hypothetical protein
VGGGDGVLERAGDDGVLGTRLGRDSGGQLRMRLWNARIVTGVTGLCRVSHVAAVVVSRKAVLRFSESERIEHGRIFRKNRHQGENTQRLSEVNVPFGINVRT